MRSLEIPQAWNRTLWALRFACPAAMFVGIGLAYMAIVTDNPLFAAIDGALVGFNLCLTMAQWTLFQPWRGERR